MKSSGPLPEHVQEFSRELFRNGVHVLGCGGGVIPEPRKAIVRLKRRYGESGLRDRCMEICMLPEAVRSNLPEGVLQVVHGILYHLGDERVLKTLCEHIHADSAGFQEGVDGEYAHQLGRINTLIAGLSMKLNHSLPPGVPPFQRKGWEYIFCPGEDADIFDLPGAGCVAALIILAVICAILALAYVIEGYKP